MKHIYEISVGNVGIIQATSRKAAEKMFGEWVACSRGTQGRACGEPVVLIVDGEPVREYHPCNCHGINCHGINTHDSIRQGRMK